MKKYPKSIKYSKDTKCCVEDCLNLADYEVVLYDYYPNMNKTFYEQDDTCPFLCQHHVDENEKKAEGSKAPRDVTSYPYTNKHNAQGHSKYNLLKEVYPVFFQD
jgi:hypothetical protein